MRLCQLLCRLNLVLTIGLLWAVPHVVRAVDVELTLNNGNVISGELVSRNTQTVIVKVAGIETRYSLSNIKKYEEILTPAQEYEKKRGELKDDDLEGRYKLASWLYQEKKAYDLAEKELVSLNKDFPTDQRVPLLLRIVRNKRTLQKDDTRTPATATVRKVTPAATPVAPRITQTTPSSIPRTPQTNKPEYTHGIIPVPQEALSDEQIDLIKVYEVNLNQRPRVVIKRSDLEDFIQTNIGKEGVPENRRDKDRFLRMEGYEQLAVFFRAKARDFYGKARVLGDPEVFKDFKILHRTYIMNRCATTDCHGGTQARGIYLFNRRPGLTPDQIVYTNFYILNSYGATKGGTRYDMIDRADPQRSLLLQFGMNPEDAIFPHPPVRGMQAAFTRGQEDRQYITIRNWIQSLYSPAPDYGIDYRIPAAPGTIEPAPTPSAN
ncbi:MAG: hypothetical protein ACF8OB_14310 [Phycisphaeraceae bacterium JB051]